MKTIHSVLRLGGLAVLALVLTAGLGWRLTTSARADDHGHGHGHHGGGHGEGNGPSFGLQNLNGRYITAGNANDASLTGEDASDPDVPARPFVGAGYLLFDGNGNITAGEETINYGTPGTGDSFTCSFTGTYTVDSATGRVSLDITVSPSTFVGPGESSGSNAAQCGGAGTWVGYLDGPAGKRLATIEQTVVAGTPTPPVAFNTPILSAHIWTKGQGD